MTGFGKPDKELAAQNRRLEAEIQKLKEACVGLNMKNRALESELEEAQDECRQLKEAINRAKDMRPWQRPSLSNVRILASRAFLDITKVAGGWVVSMGSSIGKKFKTLRDIWIILTQESWSLHDDFLPYTEQEHSAPAAEAPAAEAAEAPAAEAAPAINLEVLAAEWRMFPQARQAIRETLARLGLNQHLFETA